MSNAATITLIVGALAIAGYFLYRSVSSTSSECNGTWTDYINPLCIAGSAASQATNEINTVLIIVVLGVVLIVGLLAFGPSTAHIANAAGKFAIL